MNTIWNQEIPAFKFAKLYLNLYGLTNEETFETWINVEGLFFSFIFWMTFQGLPKLTN